MGRDAWGGWGGGEESRPAAGTAQAGVTTVVQPAKARCMGMIVRPAGGCNWNRTRRQRLPDRGRGQCLTSPEPACFPTNHAALPHATDEHRPHAPRRRVAARPRPYYLAHRCGTNRRVSRNSNARFAKPRTGRRGVFCWLAWQLEAISRNNRFAAHSTPFVAPLPHQAKHRTPP